MDDPVTAVDSSLEARAEPQPLIEVGLVIAGRLDPVDREAVEVAKSRVAEELQRRFDRFTWRLDLVLREEMRSRYREQPVWFFSQGQTERDVHRWDFVLIITSADLIGHDQPFALAAVSRTLDLAVISTGRVDPRAVDSATDTQARISRIGERLSVLMLRCLGHLNGLDTSQSPVNLMWDVDDVEELDQMSELDEAQVAEMQQNLAEIADLRLEEQTEVGRQPQLLFLLRAAWSQRAEIAGGVVDAQPWQFPLRLSRLTTAAASAMLVLLMTAETWEMAMSQPPHVVMGLLLAVMIVTTCYVVIRQRLLVRRRDRSMTEQIAVTNISAVLIVLCGLTTTLVALFAISLLLSETLFSRSVIAAWAASVEKPLTFRHHLLLSAVVAGFSLCIGALGAAFEDQAYFRHITFVDEEL